MKNIKISGSISGVISTGSFQNLRPAFTWEEELTDCSLSDAEIQERRKQLFSLSLSLLKDAENQAIIERIERERKDIRFIIGPVTGAVLPSVTSVINWDVDFFVPAHELSQYASQSNIVHERVSQYILGQGWLEPKNITDCWADIVICTKGNLALEIDTGNFPAFLEKNPIKDMKNGETVYLENTAGTPDFSGIPTGWKEAKEVLTVFDVKRTPDKIKNGMQLSQYCKGMQSKQGIIIPLNDKTVQGHSKPIIYTAQQLEGYDKMFQTKRSAFHSRYGI